MGWVTGTEFNTRCRKSISVRNQPPRSTQPGHPSVGRCNEYQPKGGDEVLYNAIQIELTFLLHQFLISSFSVNVWTDRHTDTMPASLAIINTHAHTDDSLAQWLTRWSRSMKLLYTGPVSTGMGDSVWGSTSGVGKSISMYNQSVTQVNSAWPFLCG